MAIAAKRPLKSFINRAKQRGSFITEYGFVLTLAALGLIGVVWAASAYMNSQSETQLGKDLAGLVNDIKGAYKGDYGNVSNSNIHDNNIFKKYQSWTDNAGTVNVELTTGTLAVTPGQLTSANDSFKVALTTVPDSSCVNVVNTFKKNAKKITVGSNTVVDVGAAWDASAIKCAGDATTVTAWYQ